MSDKSYNLHKKSFFGDKEETYTFLRPLEEGSGKPTVFITIPRKPEAEVKTDKAPSFLKTFFQGKFKDPLFQKGFGFMKQAGLAAAIFGITFLALNYQAYYQIAKVKVSGTQAQANVLQQYAKPKAVPLKQQQTLLKVAKTPAEEKKNIPQVNLAVAPPDTRLIIPKIGKNIPIIQVSDEQLIKKDFSALEADIQKGLQGGVINYPGTSKPGETGNVVITGHSSYFPWSAGGFKDVFAILSEVKVGDKLILFNKQRKYVYTVTAISEVYPKDVEPLKQTTDNVLTLITCTPVGTDLRRLIVRAKLDFIES